jgi:2-succinyl-5-enolpyruvyl-6-hydroxy-3-cyclohexene-1-carboxylate synthase
MSSSVPTLTIGAAMAALINARTTHQPHGVLVSTMSGMQAIDDLGETERRLESVPLMGGASGLGLGIALARPEVPVVIVDGDSSLLMELGSLVTVASNKPRRYLHIVNNNGVQFHSITNLPALSANGQVDFAAMARAAGYTRAQRIDNYEDWVAALPALLTDEGCSFVELVTVADPRRVGPQWAQPILPDFQFARMRIGARKLQADLAP